MHRIAISSRRVMPKFHEIPAEQLTQKNHQSLLSFLGLLELTGGRPCGLQTVPNSHVSSILLLSKHHRSLLILVPGNSRNSIIHLPSPQTNITGLFLRLLTFAPQVCTSDFLHCLLRIFPSWRRGLGGAKRYSSERSWWFFFGVDDDSVSLPKMT